tara:strand:+ start:107 stop:520 length:414 start_codon:yes stop_codon:yes gene_type:complete
MESSLKNKFIIFKILTIFYLLAFTKIVYAQGSAVDQYRQMGGIVGLTETCFKTNNLEIILFKQVGQVFFSQPQMGLMMTQLLTAYFESKQIAKTKKVIWNGSSQSYSKKTMDCNNKNDLKLIKNFENQMINSLNQKK